MDLESVVKKKRGRIPSNLPRKQLGGTYIEPVLKDRITEIAKKERRSFSAQVGLILSEWVSQNS